MIPLAQCKTELGLSQEKTGQPPKEGGEDAGHRNIAL